MNSIGLIRVMPKEGHDDLSVQSAPRTAPGGRRMAAPLRGAIMRTRQWLLAQQHADGYWVAELEGDSILESEYVLMLAYLGRERTPMAKRCAAYLVEQQLDEGGWSLYPGGQLDVSASVKAYFVLKLTGHDPGGEVMQRARKAILAHGGADAVNSFTRFYLALLGQVSYEQCPAVAPEVMLLPRWFPFNIYKVSAWSRTILVPLSIMWAHRPVREIDPRYGIRELFVADPEDWPEARSPGMTEPEGQFSWSRLFRLSDRVLKFLERRGIRPLRRRALRKASAWMLDRFENSDGLGAIFPPLIWSVVALKCLGYDDDSPEVRYNLEHLESLAIDEGETTRLQPCKSPVWDTAITMRALAESGMNPDDPRMARAARWLLDQEIRKPGDWAHSVKESRESLESTGGWCFEHANAFYPDMDDTAMVLMALSADLKDGLPDDDSLPPEFRLVAETSAEGMDEARRKAAAINDTAGAIERGTNWILMMQNRDGGWGAFDRDNDRQALCHVPFADHNAMIDPSTPDLASRVLEALGRLGRRVGDPAVDRAVAYLRSTQEPDGSWFGRWGVNYIYGTWQGIIGMREVGLPKDDPNLTAAANWLLAHQQSDGGWGESPDSYADPKLRGQGSTTASQTAWAIMGLVAAGLHDHPAVARAVRFLLNNQCEDGTWDEPEFTGTGFPQVFYLRYHMYPIYFPLMALSRWAVAIGADLRTAETAAQRLADAGVNGEQWD